jgi:hypothetical protein
MLVPGHPARASLGPVARRRNAIVTAVFTYGQSTLGMVLGLIVTRTVLHILGKDTWGLWAASGSLLSYAGLADLGVLRILPWVVADADGKKDQARIRASLSSSVPFACVTAVAYVCIGLLLWHFYPSLLQLSPRDQSALRGPVFAVVFLTALSFPLRIFTALLTGLQDATFLGTVGLVEVVESSVLTFVLAWRGFGLYSLAIGMALPPTFSAVAAVVRANVSFRGLVRGWPKPARTLMGALAIDGLGAWLGSVGFQLAAAADPVILSNAGLRAAVAGFVLTSRLPMTLTQFAWILPDASLVGLAQLNAEAGRARVREVVVAMLRLNLILAGVVASAVLASNAGFIRIWVGADLFLGARLNALMAANAVLMTAVHGLVTIACVFRRRMTVGIVFVVNGLLHVVLGSVLCRHIGVYGISAATFISGAVTALPVGLHLLEPQTGLTARAVLTEVYWPWLRRFAPLAVIAFFLGRSSPALPFPVLVLACSAFGFAYLFWMKPLYVGLPLGPRLTGWLVTLRLLPRSAS